MKHTKKCPECGGTEIYTRQISSNGYESVMLNDLRSRPSEYTIFNVLFPPDDYTKFDVFVCVACGYYQMFLDEAYFDDVRKKMKRYE